MVPPFLREPFAPLSAQKEENKEKNLPPTGRRPSTTQNVTNVLLVPRFSLRFAFFYLKAETFGRPDWSWRQIWNIRSTVFPGLCYHPLSFPPSFFFLFNSCPPPKPKRAGRRLSEAAAARKGGSFNPIDPSLMTHLRPTWTLAVQTAANNQVINTKVGGALSPPSPFTTFSYPPPECYAIGCERLNTCSVSPSTRPNQRLIWIFLIEKKTHVRRSDGGSRSDTSKLLKEEEEEGSLNFLPFASEWGEESRGTPVGSRLQRSRSSKVNLCPIKEDCQ